MEGIDVSENNGIVDWDSIEKDFAIVRLGYSDELDSQFYDNVNGVLDKGMGLGIYLYSYALDVDSAIREADFVKSILDDCGITENDLTMGIWFDMEDADGYKERHGVTDADTITDICKAFIDRLSESYSNVGLYANYDWLTNRIYTSQLNCPIWCAQYNSQCDYEGATLWQYTDSEYIDGKYFDGDTEL